MFMLAGISSNLLDVYVHSGSCLTLWEEMLPVVPPEDVAAVLAVAVEALADLGEPRI